MGKTTLASTHCLFSKADPIPAESTWTHVLINFQKTILRRVAMRLGIDSFMLGIDKEEEDQVGEGRECHI